MADTSADCTTVVLYPLIWVTNVTPGWKGEAEASVRRAHAQAGQLTRARRRTASSFIYACPRIM
jgi:hypothetical protein